METKTSVLGVKILVPTEEERRAESDFCNLLAAKEVRSDETRLKRAQAFEQTMVDQRGQKDEVVLRQDPLVVYRFDEQEKRR